jgi:hypothetical protein
MDILTRELLECGTNKIKQMLYQEIEIYGHPEGSPGLRYMVEIGEMLLNDQMEFPPTLGPIFSIKEYLIATNRSELLDDPFLYCKICRLSKYGYFWGFGPTIKRKRTYHYGLAGIPSIENAIHVAQQQKVYI